jgi:hypothetical protein
MWSYAQKNKYFNKDEIMSKVETKTVFILFLFILINCANVKRDTNPKENVTWGITQLVDNINIVLPNDFQRWQFGINSPNSGTFSNRNTLFSFEYGKSYQNLQSLKMFYSNEPNFKMDDTIIDNKKALILTYHYEGFKLWYKRVSNKYWGPKLNVYEYGTILHIPSIDNENNRLTLIFYSEDIESYNNVTRIIASVKYRE